MIKHPAVTSRCDARRILLWLLPAILLAVVLLALSVPARADSGGWPTRPPTETPLPTSTSESTAESAATFIPQSSSVTLPFIFPPPADQATVVPHSIPTPSPSLVLLSDEELLATLQATPTQIPEDKSSRSVWVYAILGILAAVAIAALIAWIVTRYLAGRQP